MPKVLEIALAEDGYLEKKSAAQLDSKTANAGSGNFTKYARDLFPHLQGQPWCDMFVDWCMVQAYGKEKAKELLCGAFCAYTPDSAALYKKKKQWGTVPKVGAQIFFKNSQRICHTGLVYMVANGKIYTIEGNTSGASGVIANGGGVCRKAYSASYCRIAGYGYPKYPEESGSTAVSKSDPVIRNIQSKLNQKYAAGIEVDGEYGPNTHKALITAFQKEYLKDGSTKPATFGEVGAWLKIGQKRIELRNGDTGNMVYILQCFLYCKGYTSVGTPDGEFGPKTVGAVKAFQREHELVADGVAGVLTFGKMMDSVG